MVELHWQKDTLLERLAGEHILRIVVGGIIEKQNRILILQRAFRENFLPGIHEIPSGQVESHESLYQALKREIREETGLTLTDVKHYVGYFDYFSRTGILTRQFNFVVATKNSFLVKLNPTEHQAYAWIEEKEMNTYNVSPELKETLKKYWFLHSANLSLNLPHYSSKL